MKIFTIYDYPKSCPLSKEVENTVNNCKSASKYLVELKDILGQRIQEFFIACILYWSETKYYDDRNKFAVLVSREIAKAFPKLKKIPKDEKLMREAYVFSTLAHRYLQNELFKVIILYLKEENLMNIHQWYEQASFVIDPITETAMPYEEYKKLYR